MTRKLFELTLNAIFVLYIYQNLKRGQGVNSPKNNKFCVNFAEEVTAYKRYLLKFDPFWKRLVVFVGFKEYVLAWIPCYCSALLRIMKYRKG